MRTKKEKFCDKYIGVACINEIAQMHKNMTNIISQFIAVIVIIIVGVRIVHQMRLDVVLNNKEKV